MSFVGVQQTKAQTSDWNILPLFNCFLKKKSTFCIEGLGFFKWSGYALKCTAENLKEISLFHPLARKVE